MQALKRLLQTKDKPVGFLDETQRKRSYYKPRTNLLGFWTKPNASAKALTTNQGQTCWVSGRNPMQALKRLLQTKDKPVEFLDETQRKG